MTDKATYDTTPEKTNQLIKVKELDLEAGLLGKFFGADTRASSNIAGLLIILLVLSGIILLFVESKIPASEYWKITTPIITLALGYLFGKNTS